MIDTSAFTKMVPGFDFLQGLMQGAGQAAPAMGQWIAPTLNPEELEKRIGELKTVQFWLEQNSRMIGVTIQALEVQRMTLSTLQTMNLPMADLRNALTLPTMAAAAEAPAMAPAPSKPAIAPLPAAGEAAASKPAAAAPAKAGAVDPMLWWGALTQQFTELATKAMQDSRAAATHTLAAAKAAGGASAPQTPAAKSKVVPAKTASAKPSAKPARKRP